MEQLNNKIVSLYETLSAGSDPEISSWPLMGSPLPVASILGFYAWFVLYYGPKHMADKQPYRIEWIIKVYNVLQVLSSVYLVAKCVRSSPYFYEYVFGFGCTTISAHVDQLFMQEWNRCAWTYIVAKFVDLLDTCFFVLRKKQTHVSFLHVYHHIAIILFSWGALKYIPGQEGMIIFTLNTFIHVIMWVYLKL